MRCISVALWNFIFLWPYAFILSYYSLYFCKNLIVELFFQWLSAQVTILQDENQDKSFKCKLCDGKEVYFGRTTQECHDRTSGHRGSFTDEKLDKSALSMHANDVHQTRFSLDIFSVAVIKKVSPQRLRREEFKFIDKYRTNSLGLNRYKS